LPAIIIFSMLSARLCRSLLVAFLWWSPALLAVLARNLSDVLDTEPLETGGVTAFPKPTITPAFGYGTSARGTPTLMNNALLSAHFGFANNPPGKRGLVVNSMQ